MPADIAAAIEEIRAVNAAGERFGSGAVFIDNAPHMDTILAARVGEREIRVQQRRPFGDVRQDNGFAHFIVRAANARPALATIAGACVLPVEVVRVLVEAMLVVSRAEGLSREWLAALAAAEAEVARVEVAP